MHVVLKLAALTAFLVAVTAIREHADLIQAGYEVSALETARHRLIEENARLREQVERLGSPLALAERAKELGIAFTEGTPSGPSVVRIEEHGGGWSPLARND